MTPVIAETAARQLLKGITIPPQPQLMVDLHMELMMPNVCIDTITNIITKDAGISGSILKIVNSPFFGLRTRITSIKQALSLLGISNIINIVNSLSIRDSLTDNSIIEMTRFWDNSIDVAMAAASISRLTGISSPDEAYTLGLFHNCGISLLINKFEHYPKVLQKAYAQQQSITDIENDMIDSNHSVIGYFVARAWKLPEYISEAIADHHRTECIFSDEVACDKRKKNLLATLKLAETTCKTHQSLGNAEFDHEFDRIKNDLLIYIGLSAYDFEDLQYELVEMGINQGTV